MPKYEEVHAAHASTDVAHDENVPKKALATKKAEPAIDSALVASALARFGITPGESDSDSITKMARFTGIYREDDCKTLVAICARLGIGLPRDIYRTLLT